MHVVKIGLAIMLRARIAMEFWNYSFKSVVYLINCMPIKVLNNVISFEVLYKRKSNCSHPSVYGCLCYHYLRRYSSHKLKPHPNPYIFISYETHHKGFWCLEPVTQKALFHLILSSMNQFFLSLSHHLHFH